MLSVILFTLRGARRYSGIVSARRSPIKTDYSVFVGLNPDPSPIVSQLSSCGKEKAAALLSSEKLTIIESRPASCPCDVLS